MSNNNYFVYKGIYYGVGTTVLLTEETCQKRFVSSQNKNKPHTFTCSRPDGRYNFSWVHPDGGRYGCSGAAIYNPDEEIAEIVHPVYVHFVPWYKSALNNMTSGKVHADVFGGVLMYIVTMLVGLLFYDVVLIWIFATVIFIVWLLNQYRT